MKPRSEKNWQSDTKVILKGYLVLAVIVAVYILAALAFGGCAGTTRPTRVQSAVASFDRNEQNSGFIAFAPDGSGIITAHAHARYQALVADYGARFKPPLISDEGTALTSTNTWTIDRGHLAQFMTMQRWKKQQTK